MSGPLEPRPEAAAKQAPLLDWKTLALFGPPLGIVFLLMLRFNSSHGLWSNLLGPLIILGLCMIASLLATDGQQRWWRKIAAAALNVWMAGAVGLVPMNMQLQFWERGAHWRDGVIAQIAVPTVMALLAALFAAAKVGAQQVLKRGSRGAGRASA